MAGASGKSFKDSYGASSEFKGGMVNPATIMIVGLDIPADDWNEDLHDQDRLAISRHSVESDEPEAKAFIASILEFGVTDPIPVVKRRGLILAVDGRRRIMGARKANEILKASKKPLAIEVPMVVDKTDDQTAAMRLGNVYRLSDPPFVKARQAAQLRRLGKDDRQISILLGGVEPITLKNWAHYMDAIPEIQRLVEVPEPGKDALPFAIAYEIGKIGKGEKKRQLLAIDTLIGMGAKLTGEQGRDNVKAVVSRILDGSITEAPTAPAPVAAPATEEIDIGAETAPAREKPAKAPPRPAAPPSGDLPSLAIAARPKPAQIAKIVAYLEPTDLEPHETDADRLAYAIAQVYAGQDPTCAGLEPWGDIQVQFQRALGITSKAPKKGKAKK